MVNGRAARYLHADSNNTNTRTNKNKQETRAVDMDTNSRRGRGNGRTHRTVKAVAALDEADVETRVELLKLGARHIAQHAPRGEAVRVARLRPVGRNGASKIETNRAV